MFVQNWSVESNKVVLHIYPFFFFFNWQNLKNINTLHTNIQTDFQLVLISTRSQANDYQQVITSMFHDLTFLLLQD